MGAQNLEESHSQTVALPAAPMIAAYPSMVRVPSALLGSAGRLPVRVLIASKHALCREGLCLVLAQQEDMQIIDEAADGTQTLHLAEAQQPQAGELAILAHLRARSPRTHILILADLLDEAFIVEVFQHGAMGYLLKTATQHDLIKAMHALYAGELWVQRKVLIAVLEHTNQMRRDLPCLTFEWQETLTDREREAVTVGIRGKTNKAITTQLAISEKTVKAHLRNIFPKLNDEQRQPPLVDRCTCWHESMEADPTAPSGTGDRAYRACPWRARDPPPGAGVGE
jgi:DNA-binding NarL/FixJ family response regulator